MGFEIDRERVKQLNRGESYLSHFPAGQFEQLVRSKSFRATSEFEGLANCDAAIICVPTPLAQDEHAPDLRHVRAAARRPVSQGL